MGILGLFFIVFRIAKKQDIVEANKKAAAAPPADAAELKAKK